MNRVHPAAAAAPAHNAVVHADAGTGKTWLLTSRVMRLLLAGVAPGAILAITFTRKAAAEVEERVRRRLLELATADDAACDSLLAEIGESPDAALRARARALYEQLLDAEPPLRATTFHAFCQDILRRFALEAEVPAGFELLEDTRELRDAAWRQFDRALTEAPDTPLAQAAAVLLTACASPAALRTTLEEFVTHRSDWWAYTEDQADPAGYAATQLAATLDIGALPPVPFALEPEQRAGFERYAAQLARLDGVSFRQRAAAIEAALAHDPQAAFASLWRALFTQDGTLRALKQSQAMRRCLGEAGAHALLAAHQQLGDALRALRARENRRRTHALSCAWYVCGQWLLEAYQDLKANQALLDFDDLEWATYRLLNRSQHAEWVQYKLDQRIDHLLIDEFQDTNPTQWRLLQPLLAEMAAGGGERARSVFLVGDEKQSIYRFRRAEPALFRAARDWLTGHMQARLFGQHISWRSSPAIIDFVNLVFGTRSGAPDEAEVSGFALPEFHTHDTHHTERWGHVEVLPLVRAAPTAPAEARLRDPLRTPRQVAEDLRHREEGELICAQIRALLGESVHDAAQPRALDYGDFLILLRDRTHAYAYEEALRDAAIPYVGIGSGGLADSLEVQDLLQLLRLLLAPYDDLALAGVLRSPLFEASEADLIALARTPGPPSWYARLAVAAAACPDGVLARAAQLLEGWRALADRVPVHDLLDRIYFEANVLARYRAAAPPHLRARAEANLRRLLTLALEVGAGRYPSLARFVQQLETADADAAAPAALDGQRVRVMTIHAAKGLEAPVVFLANAAARTERNERGLRALIEWPVDAARPRYFHLVGGAAALDEVSAAALERARAAQQREESNLLYVALTRARQWLFVSGVAPRGERAGARPGRGWYGFIEQRLRAARDDGRAAALGLQISEHPDPAGTAPPSVAARLAYGERAAHAPMPAAAAMPVALDPALTQPLAVTQAPEALLAPSDEDAEHAPAPQARRQGALLHRILQYRSAGYDRAQVHAALAREWPVLPPLEAAWRTASAVLAAPALRRFFDPRHYEVAYNELPILYQRAEQAVYGVIDRVVLTREEAIVLDYKTHADADPESSARYAPTYFPQLRLYAAGVQRLWPERRVRAYLIFTACAALVEVPLA